ncbi:hypothetical protein [Marinicrinis lubricantis]|uniref:Uncharacterized protein n=1 Tax=Marinicrinis lubricantis TaxID=2086470 RepID=A0ABW1IQH4_9BACL
MILYKTAKWAEERKQLFTSLQQEIADRDQLQSKLDLADQRMLEEAEAWRVSLLESKHEASFEPNYV